MERIGFIVTLAVLSFSLAGCGKSAAPAGADAGADAGASADATATVTSSITINDNDGPDIVVFKFLESVRLGEDLVAETLLTPIAQEKTKAMNMVVAPPGSDTASFRVGQVKPTGQDLCEVQSQWTDLDDEGKPKTDEIIWSVRRVNGRWRIAGMAAKIFPDLPPVVMNFENPEDMIQQRKMAEEEATRRQSGSQELEARKTGDPFQQNRQ